MSEQDGVYPDMTDDKSRAEHRKWCVDEIREAVETHDMRLVFAFGVTYPVAGGATLILEVPPARLIGQMLADVLGTFAVALQQQGHGTEPEIRRQLLNGLIAESARLDTATRTTEINGVPVEIKPQET
jgi:hypothetical protein